jgi:hypothetical protein
MTRWVGYIFCVCTQRARMCAVTYFWMDYLQIYWEYTTHHHKLHGLCTFHVQALRAHMVKRLLIFRRIPPKFTENILRITTIMLHGLCTFHVIAPRMRVITCLLIFGQIVSKLAENIL